MANAAEVLIETLIDWNVHVVFGLPGDGINVHGTDVLHVESVASLAYLSARSMRGVVHPSMASARASRSGRCSNRCIASESTRRRARADTVDPANTIARPRQRPVVLDVRSITTDLHAR